ncbi:hypothetical protein [Providencia sp. Je.9.19]|uniref:hypothetical protein n=1 Tax=unclassified Providencia TaxID=2633465 RepID=UPI003DA8B3CA
MKIASNTVTTPTTNVNHKNTTKGISSEAMKSVTNKTESFPQSILKKNEHQKLPVESRHVTFSNKTQVKEFHSSIEAQGNLQTKTDINETKVNTTAKTVHLKEINQLKKNITSCIDKITQDIKNNNNKHLGRSFSYSPADMSKKLVNLNTQIQSYQNKLDSSSYKHHDSKQATLTKLQENINKAKENVGKEINKQNYIRGQSEIKTTSLLERMSSAAQRATDYAENGSK